MFAKIFSQIFDSSIADDRPLRHFFMDMLVLADPNGVVDMTPNAIAKRTGWPLEDVLAYLAVLTKPDPQSRTPDHDGARLGRLDSHRDWGWVILNYQTFRETASEQQRRSRTLERVRKFRKNTTSPVTPCNAPVTPCNACNTQVTPDNASVENNAPNELRTPEDAPITTLTGKNISGLSKDKNNLCNAPVTHGNACNAMQKQKQKQKHIGIRTAFRRPSLDEIKLLIAKAGLPEKEAIKFFNHYESNGWKVGRNPMKSVSHAVGNWSVNFHERTYQPNLAPAGPSLTQKIIDSI